MLVTVNVTNELVVPTVRSPYPVAVGLMARLAGVGVAVPVPVRVAEGEPPVVAEAVTVADLAPVPVGWNVTMKVQEAPPASVWVEHKSLLTA